MLGRPESARREARIWEGRADPSRVLRRALSRLDDTPGTSGQLNAVSCLSLARRAALDRSGAAGSCCHRAAIQQKGPTTASGNRALTCTYLVAGAGFEPATSGL